jgi:hypothetical protein
VDEPIERPKTYSGMEEDVGRPLSERVTRIEGRLDNGNNEFSGLREHIRRVERSVEEGRVKPMTRMQLLGFVMGPVIGIIVMFGGYVWQFARYPDRQEFGAAVRELQEADKELKGQVDRIQQDALKQDLTLAESKRSLERLEKTITDRLDRLEKKR